VLDELRRSGSIGCVERSGRMALRCVLVVVAVLLGAVVGEEASAQNSAGRVQVRSLDFDGNRAFPDDSLRLAIFNRQTECRPFLDPLCWLGLGFASQEEYLIRRELPSDVARLHIYYFQRGYREARIDTALVHTPDADEVRLTFFVDEGRPVLIDSLRFVGAEEAQVDGLLRGLPISEGVPLSAIRLDQARDSLLTRLRNQGYPYADVLRSLFIPSASPYSAQVMFDIDAGPRARIGALEIVVSGEAELSEQVVRRMLPFQEGSVYSAADIQQAQRNLYGLEIVSNALIAQDTARMRTLPDTLVPLRIEVGTNTLHRVRVGGGWNMADCMSAETRWASRNVLGGAQRLQVSARLSNMFAEQLGTACEYAGVGDFGGLNWSVSAELNQPWLFSPRNSLTTSLFWERQSLPDVFIRQSVGLNVLMTRSLASRTPLVLSYRPQRSSLEAAGVFFCTSLLVCNPEDIAVLEDANRLAPLGVGVSRDRTDNLLNPAAGYAAHADLEHASALTGSDFAYTRLTADASVYQQLTDRSVLAARLRGGWVGAGDFGQIQSNVRIVHPQARFFAGGASSVRGFGQSRLGPSVLTVGATQLLGPVELQGGEPVFLGPCTPEQIVAFTCDAGALSDGAFTQRPIGGTRLLEANLEYRAAFATAFQGVAFLDFGQVWTEQSPSLSLSTIEWTPGVGVRYFSPIGPLRLDVAYRFGGGEALPVVTSRIRPFDPLLDRPEDRICFSAVCDTARNPDAVVIPWVRQDELALLGPSVFFNRNQSFFGRLQIHFSIGQAF